MTTQTVTLADFLLARLDDNARQAHTFHLAGCTGSASMYPPAGQPVAPICGCGLPAWILAECEAKRRIMELHWVTKGDRSLRCAECAPGDYYDHDPMRSIWPCATLRFLALPHADHPDFRDEWRP